MKGATMKAAMKEECGKCRDGSHCQIFQLQNNMRDVQ